jgi:hypothetical protein
MGTFCSPCKPVLNWKECTVRSWTIAGIRRAVIVDDVHPPSMVETKTMFDRLEAYSRLWAVGAYKLESLHNLHGCQGIHPCNVPAGHSYSALAAPASISVMKGGEILVLLGVIKCCQALKCATVRRELSGDPAYKVS